MKVSIVINNYNYSAFIVDCVNSVLQQTYENIEIIIIDDGSTDNSVELLKESYIDNELIKIISKKNEGQLSTFNQATKYATGDIICFLDSDDLYKKDYVEKIVELYKNDDSIDFVFCAIENFFTNGSKEIIQQSSVNIDIGFSVLSTIYLKEWVGNVTSSVSMRKNLFNQIFPLELENDWITRADDCLVWGSSIYGAKKYYCADPLILYRIHETNNYYGKEFSNAYLYKREIKINKLFKSLIDKAEIDSTNLLSLILIEFTSRGNKNINLLFKYLKILSFESSFLKKIKRTIKLLQIYIIELKNKK
jgi:glycosyltransferase involved in cell wall biosynthesis